jgi:hypothetical protein
MGTAVLDFFQCFGVTRKMFAKRLPTVFLLFRLRRSNSSGVSHIAATVYFTPNHPSSYLALHQVCKEAVTSTYCSFHTETARHVDFGAVCQLFWFRAQNPWPCTSLFTLMVHTLAKPTKPIYGVQRCIDRQAGQHISTDLSRNTTET